MSLNSERNQKVGLKVHKIKTKYMAYPTGSAYILTHQKK